METAWPDLAGADDDAPVMKAWVVDLREVPPTELPRCECQPWRPWSRCAYHRADWPLILGVAVEEFRVEFGDARVDLNQARDRVRPKVDARLQGRWRRRDRMFAWSIFSDPMYATDEQ